MTTIEYSYKTYKVPGFSSNEAITIDTEFITAITNRLFPEVTEGVVKYSPFYKIAKDDKTYVCGFIGEKVEETSVIKVMYFVTIYYDSAGQQINCYKCNIGDVNNGSYAIDERNAMIEVWEGNSFRTTLFGFFDSSTGMRFYLPPHSFFLEGDHRAVSDLPVGAYEEGITRLISS